MSSAALAAGENERLKIILPAWGITLHHDGSGLYNEIFRSLTETENENFQTSYVPYEEALRRLFHGQADCAYPIPKPALAVSLPHADMREFVQSAPVLISRSYIFSREGDVVISGVQALKNKLVIQIMGENYNHNFAGLGVQMVNVQTETEKVELLMAGRGHAMVASMPDILYSFRALKMEPLPFDANFSILNYENSMTCRRSPRNVAFLEAFNHRLSEVMGSGKLRELLIAQGIPENLVDDYLIK